MSSFVQPSVPNSPRRRNRGLERVFAIVAIANFALVLFDSSYIPWRDAYLQFLPGLTQYDSIKGIEPHRETQRYLDTVNALTTEVTQTGLQSESTEKLLQDLRFLSNEMIEDNPFAEANKTGSLAKIKHLMRSHMNQESAHQAFNLFWTQMHLAQSSWDSEIHFFNTQIEPLIVTNYYRDIDINGKFVDRFWLIDLPFVLFFGFEFLFRTYTIGRRNPDLTWLQAMLRRWFDVLLLLPFSRWSRIVPITVRLYQSELIDLEPLREQINHDVVVNFAEEITEMVGIRLIDQAQDAVKRGDVAQWVLHPDSRRPYININNTNEVQAIASRLLQLTVYQVLPKIQPDIEALLHHNIKTVFNQSPIYKQLQNVPGVGHLPAQVSENLAKDLSQSLYNTFTTILEDPVAAQLANSLMQNFSKTLEAEVQQQHNVQEIQSLVVDLLEEIKINYVKGIAEDGVEKILDESQQIRKIVRY